MARTMDADAPPDEAAQAAARAAGVAVHTLTELRDLAGAVELIGAIWGRNGASPVLSLDLVRAICHAGGYAAGAFDGVEMVGASVAFLGRYRGRPSLHSHVTGVAPHARSRSVGFALKQHQRAWALDQGYGQVTWTFDPLVRRNAYFNIARLGAEAAAYLPNFYGAMDDTLNRGDESDRLHVWWDLASEAAARAAARASSAEEAPGLDALRARGAVVALDATVDGAPSLARADRIEGASIRLCAVPEDIVALRRDNLTRALAWRHALREALGGALDAGMRVTGFLRDGWYVLERA